jgi:hypothetical protein
MCTCCTDTDIQHTKQDAGVVVPVGSRKKSGGGRVCERLGMCTCCTDRHATCNRLDSNVCHGLWYGVCMWACIHLAQTGAYSMHEARHRCADVCTMACGVVG